MAEARSAVAFQFSVNDEGVLEFDYNNEAIKLVLDSIKHYFFASIHWGQRIIRNDTFPLNISSFLLSYVIILAGYGFNCDWIKHKVLLVSYIMPGGYPKVRNLLAFIIMPALTWFIAAKAFQIIVRTILYYFLREQFLWKKNDKFPNKQIRVILFYLVGGIKKVFDRRTSLYCFQNCIPNLAVPSLDETINTWLASVRPLRDEVGYLLAVEKAEEFKNGVGRKIQLLLRLKHLLYPNYISDWWEKYVYLASRSPLPINSNYFIVDSFGGRSYDQMEKAALMIYYMMIYKENIEKETLEPVLYQGSVPLCSSQYRRSYNTARLPGSFIDTLTHTPGNNFVIIYNKGRFYRLSIFSGGRRLSILELYDSIKYILQDTSDCTDAEIHLPSLTALPRSEWAKIRLEHFTHGVNKVSYETICKSAFFVSFDDHESYLDSDESLSKLCSLCLHGRGYDRWFDKSINLIVFKNGKIGMTVEHSWADAPVMAQLNERCLMWIDELGDASEIFKKKGSGKLYVSRLEWNLTNVANEIEKSFLFSVNMVSDCDLQSFSFDDFGKAYPKKVGLSPDGFIQAALQLAYYRDVGEFCLTYESAMTRMFKDGRTETTRSCTIEICDFVLSLDNVDVDHEEKVKLLRKALDMHVKLNRLSLMGYGCDRHLFGLLVVARACNIEVPFLNEVLSEPWKLSTSQTPINLSGILTKNDFKRFKVHGGGFGPVHDDGYGVSYIISGEDLITFHVSSKFSSKITDSKRMAKNIKYAMHKLKNLMDLTL